MAKNIQNIDVVACKLKLTLIRVINYKLKVAQKKQSNWEKIIKNRKIKAIIVKYHRNKRGISLFSRQKRNYKGDSRDNMDSN